MVEDRERGIRYTVLGIPRSLGYRMFLLLWCLLHAVDFVQYPASWLFLTYSSSCWQGWQRISPFCPRGNRKQQQDLVSDRSPLSLWRYNVFLLLFISCLPSVSSVDICKQLGLDATKALVGAACFLERQSQSQWR